MSRSNTSNKKHASADAHLDALDEDPQVNANAGYSWEDSFKRSWDTIEEDENGTLKPFVANFKDMKKKRKYQQAKTVQRGIIRHLVIILDLSACMTEKDLNPSRISLTSNYIKSFMVEFFDQNPISQISLVITKNGIAEKITELGGNPTEHIKALNKKALMEPSGEPSLQNALSVAINSLIHVPFHASREVICIFGSLTTSDPGDIRDTIQILKKENIKCNMVGLAAEVSIFKKICKETNGKYSVIFNEGHFRDVLFEFVAPPAIQSQEQDKVDLVRMGFPKQFLESTLSPCACHKQHSMNGYLCPRCGSQVCQLPVGCCGCGLTLISSPHLARSYHHLFPIESFEELPFSKIRFPSCFSCHFSLPLFDSNGLEKSDPKYNEKLEEGSNHFKCLKCSNEFCLDCDLFVHEVLHNCPGCL